MRTSIEGESDSTVTLEEFKCRSVSITFLYDTFIEADGEACAAFRAVRRAKRSILRRQNHAGESKTDTDTLGGRSLSFIETFEEVRQILRREAGGRCPLPEFPYRSESQRAVIRMVPPTGVCSRQFFRIFPSASLLHSGSPVKLSSLH